MSFLLDQEVEFALMRARLGRLKSEHLVERGLVKLGFVAELLALIGTIRI